MTSTPHQLSATIKSLAFDLGFNLAGIARVQPSAHADAYKKWLAQNKHGEMNYLARHIEERLDLNKKFSWGKSIVCVALSYWQSAPGSAGGSNANSDSARDHGTDSTTRPHEPPAKPGADGKIARYAWGRDYHKVMEAKLRRLEKIIRELLPHQPLELRSYCDTGPILEREYAALAGLGWVGKNTLLLHPRHGSWFVLGELITSLDLEPDSPIGTHCGTCTRCIDACPTDAIEPFSVDATKCISYLTIEHRDAIDASFNEPLRDAGYLIGCDICQEVCPFNRDPLACSEPDFAPRAPAPEIKLQKILAWQEQDWDIMTRGRAFRRAKFDMWQRNARILNDSSARTDLNHRVTESAEDSQRRTK